MKGIQFEGLRVVGDPFVLATKYASEGAHELLYIDSVASLYGRNQLTRLLEETTQDVFIPVTVAGGIKSKGDAERLFRAGADKVAINTAAIKRPELIKELSDYYGSQAVVVSVEAKRNGEGWECFTDAGREKTGLRVEEWIQQAIGLGAGEILLTSIDKDGMMNGPDLDLVRRVSGDCPVPLTVGGGISNARDIEDTFQAGADAVAIGAALHYGRFHMKHE